MKVEHVPRALVEKFAFAFAGERAGFSAREISDYFTGYSNLVKHLDHYGFAPKRSELFIESLYSLAPRQQYYALNDLTFYERKSKYSYPSDELRRALREDLHTFISPNPIGLGYSKIRESAFRTDWIEAHRGIALSPAEAMTAARRLLETTLKTILDERQETPADKGDLGKLIKQTEAALGFVAKDHQGEHQVLAGLASIVGGISALSNESGGRHGTVGGVEIENSAIADLCVNACGTIGLFFIELHLLTEIDANKTSLLTPGPPPVPSDSTATTSTHSRSLAPGQA